MAAVSKDFNVQGCNNTGYGLKNLNRITGKFDFLINDPIEPLPIFKLLQKDSGYTDEEMYKKFNMGMGFFIICEKEDAESILQRLKNGKIVGEVRKAENTKTILEKNNKKIVFEGY
jgi:phosphoribosylformylglycinamidine cyclo-ligase